MHTCYLLTMLRYSFVKIDGQVSFLLFWVRCNLGLFLFGNLRLINLLNLNFTCYQQVLLHGSLYQDDTVQQRQPLHHPLALTFARMCIA